MVAGPAPSTNYPIAVCSLAVGESKVVRDLGPPWAESPRHQSLCNSPALVHGVVPILESAGAALLYYRGLAQSSSRRRTDRERKFVRIQWVRDGITQDRPLACCSVHPSTGCRQCRAGRQPECKVLSPSSWRPIKYRQRVLRPVRVRFSRAALCRVQRRHALMALPLYSHSPGRHHSPCVLQAAIGAIGCHARRDGARLNLSSMSGLLDFPSQCDLFSNLSQVSRRLRFWMCYSQSEFSKRQFK